MTINGLDHDPLRAWAEGVANSRLYGGMSVDELVAMARARGKEYETGELLDHELGLDVPEVGNDVMALAAKDLRARGILLADASAEQLRAALVRVSS